MKKIFSVLLSMLLVFSCCVTVLAEEAVDGDSPVVTSEYVWLYILIFILALAGVIAAAVVITKKIK